MTTIERRTDVVTIYGGDYLARIRHLEAQAEAALEAQGPGPRMLDDEAEYLELAEQHDALVREAEEQALHVTLRALGRREWRELQKAHPPRTVPDVIAVVAQGDAFIGANEETFKEALVLASITVPDDITSETLDELSDADFDRLFFTAYQLNRSQVTDPKASLVSRMTPKADETSS